MELKTDAAQAAAERAGEVWEKGEIAPAVEGLTAIREVCARHGFQSRQLAEDIMTALAASPVPMASSAGEAVAYLLTSKSGMTKWTLTASEVDDDVREAFLADGIRIEPLGHLAPPATSLREQEDGRACRLAWAKYAARKHSWLNSCLPPMRDGRFDCAAHESEYQDFLAGVRHGRS